MATMELCDRVSRLLEEEAPALTEAWARELSKRLKLDLSPYPSPEDPRLVRGIATCLAGPETRMICTMELIERARQLGEVTESKGILPEQILDGCHALAGRIWDLAAPELEEAADRPGGGPSVHACVRRIHEALVVVIRAVTDAYFRAYRERMESDAERMRSFNHMVSHELKGPISAIQGAATLLSEEGVVEDAQRRGHFIAMVHRNTERAADLVSDLLALTSTERPGLGAPAPVALGEVMGKIGDRLADEAEACDVRIGTERPLPEVAAERAALELVLTNLVANGIRHADPSKAERRVRISARRLEGERAWTVTAEDNGIGIPEEARERIFERFFRAEAVREVPGTGLGLSIVKEAVERWGGRVWFDSEEGEGTTFYFTVPAAAGDRPRGREAAD
jgi:signal transduction histidine kinase